MISAGVTCLDSNRYEISAKLDLGKTTDVYKVERTLNDFIEHENIVFDDNADLKKNLNTSSGIDGIESFVEFLLLAVNEKPLECKPSFFFLTGAFDNSIFENFLQQNIAAKIAVLNLKSKTDDERISRLEEKLANMMDTLSSLVDAGVANSVGIPKSVTFDAFSEILGKRPVLTMNPDDPMNFPLTGMSLSSKSPDKTPEHFDQMFTGIRNMSAHTLYEDVKPENIVPNEDISPLLKAEDVHLDLTSFYDHCVDELLGALRPHEAQAQYRTSVVALLQKQIRLFLNATSFEASLFQIRSFLPADPIRMTVILPRNMVQHWHVAVAEHLSRFAESPVSADDEAFAEERDAEVPSSVPPSVVPPVSVEVVNPKHLIRNVEFVGEPPNLRVSCMVDTLGVEISCNCREDLCMLAFLEEVSVLVGKDHLFKKSLLLIRSWWFYETSSYVNNSIKHYIPDFAFCVMVVAVFNQHHARIASPLQALVLFLSEYSLYDGSTQAITIYGIVPLKYVSEKGKCKPQNEENYLVSEVMLKKFFEIFNPKDQQIPMDPVNPHDRLTEMALKKPMVFEETGYNVIHPFYGLNLLTEKQSARRVGLINRAFQVGCTNMNAVLQRTLEKVKKPGFAEEVMQSYFPAVLSRFGVRWRPDVFNNSLSDYSVGTYCNMNADMERLWQSIVHCNLIVEAVFSEPAILAVCIDLLLTKGPLPAGEIGKMLADMSSIPSLSLRLRECFGGLKKFLEKFPDVFIFSNDHPFNPHVVLRSELTPEQVDRVRKGSIPEQLMARFNKLGGRKGSKTKGGDSNSLTSTNSADAYSIKRSPTSPGSVTSDYFTVKALTPTVPNLMETAKIGGKPSLPGNKLPGTMVGAVSTPAMGSTGVGNFGAAPKPGSFRGDAYSTLKYDSADYYRTPHSDTADSIPYNAAAPPADFYSQMRNGPPPVSAGYGGAGKNFPNPGAEPFRSYYNPQSAGGAGWTGGPQPMAARDPMAFGGEFGRGGMGGPDGSRFMRDGRAPNMVYRGYGEDAGGYPHPGGGNPDFYRNDPSQFHFK